MSEDWIGVDLDGTLAEWDWWKGMDCIGDPVPKMVARVKRWLAQDKEVRIFTARAANIGEVNPETGARYTREDVETPIRIWCLKHLGRELEITCKKDFGMVELWDDRCVTVETNTGRAGKWNGAANG